MDDRVLIISAVAATIIGLILLFLCKPAEEQQFVLKGMVVDRHGTSVVVNANITLITRNATKGKTIQQPAFWNGKEFVAAK